MAVSPRRAAASSRLAIAVTVAVLVTPFVGVLGTETIVSIPSLGLEEFLLGSDIGTVQYNGWTGDDAFYIAGAGNNVVSNNILRDLGSNPPAVNPFCTVGIYDPGRGAIVEKNEFSGINCIGIQTWTGTPGNATDNVIIRNNYFHNNDCAGIVASDGVNIRVYNNVVVNNGLNCVSGHSADGVVIGGVGNRGTIAYVYNNTVAGNKRECIHLGEHQQTVQNNICYGNGTDAVVNADGTDTVDHNVVGGTNPFFVGGSGLDAWNVQVRADSPVIDQGVTIPLVNNDIKGIPRTPPYDIGAFEQGGIMLPSQMIARWKLD